MSTEQNNQATAEQSKRALLAEKLADLHNKLADHTEKTTPEETLDSIIFWTDRKIIIDEILKVNTEYLKEMGKLSLAIQENKIAEPMDQMGLNSFMLANGKNVNLDKKYHAKIPASKQEEAFQWLVDNGFADTIKNVISQTFPAGEQGSKNLSDALEKIKETGLPFNLNKSIHASTLKALVKERMEKGEEVPMETLGVFVEKVIKIK